MEENRDRLAAIVTHHVVPGRVMSADAAGNTVELESVQGQMLGVDGSGYGVTVGGASVIGAEIVACNGVIHVIDEVILPDM